MDGVRQSSRLGPLGSTPLDSFQLYGPSLCYQATRAQSTPLSLSACPFSLGFDLISVVT